MIGILSGLGAALLWGVADFLARFASRSIGAFRALFYIQLAGLAVVSVVVARWPWPLISFDSLVLTIVLGAVATIATLALYRAFVVGVLAIVSPIASSGNAIAVVLALLSGERPTPLRIAGIVVTTIGVLLASADLRLVKERRVMSAGTGAAVLSALGFGVVLWGVSHLVLDVGALWTTWALRVVVVLMLMGLAFLWRQSLAPPPRATWYWIAPVGVLDVGAFLSYNVGLTTDLVAIVAVLASLFSVVTVLLAWLVLRERLAPNQWLGITLILSGVALVSLPVL